MTNRQKAPRLQYRLNTGPWHPLTHWGNDIHALLENLPYASVEIRRDRRDAEMPPRPVYAWTRRQS